MGDEQPLLPETKSQDVEDVVWGLQTAAALWGRGERQEALVWIRRAAEAAGAAGDDARAAELANRTVELEKLIAATPTPFVVEAAPASAVPSMVRRTTPPPAKPPPPKKPPKPELDDAETLDPDAAADLLGEEEPEAAASVKRAPAPTMPSSKSTGAFAALRPTSGPKSTPTVPPSTAAAPTVAAGPPSVAHAPPASVASPLSAPAPLPTAPAPHPLAATQVSPRPQAAPSASAPVSVSVPRPSVPPPAPVPPAPLPPEAVPPAAVPPAAVPPAAVPPAPEPAPASSATSPHESPPPSASVTATAAASAAATIVTPGSADAAVAVTVPRASSGSRNTARGRAAARREALPSFIGLEPADGATPRPAQTRKKRQPILDPWSDELPPSEPAPRTMAHRTETTTDETDVITSAPPLETSLKRKPPPPPPKRTQTLSGTMLAITGELPAANPDQLKQSATETPRPAGEPPRPPPTRKPTLVPRAAPPSERKSVPPGALPDAPAPREHKSTPPSAPADAPVAAPPSVAARPSPRVASEPPPAPPAHAPPAHAPPAHAPPAHAKPNEQSEPPPATMPAARTAAVPPPPPPAPIDEEPTRDDAAPLPEMPVLFGDPKASPPRPARPPSAPPPPPAAPPAPPTLPDAMHAVTPPDSPAPSPVAEPSPADAPGRAAGPATVPPEERTVGGLRLDKVDAFADVPGDVQRKLALAAQLTELGIDEEVSGFGAALVLSGGGAVCATIADAAALALAPASFVPAMTSISEAGAIRVVATEAMRIATWEKETFDDLLRACPWVLDEIVRLGDRLASLAGATMGPLGDLDEESRYAALGRLTTRALRPGEVLIPAGGELLGLTVVGAGTVALDRESDGTEYSSGDIVLPGSVMEGGVTDCAVKAGPDGALVLTATRHTTVELFSTMPALLELLRLG